jgi:hypothetical protein
VERCSDLCREDKACKWFTFNALTLECFLYSTCDSVQKTCPQCTSSGINCKGKTGTNNNLNVYLGDITPLSIETLRTITFSRTTLSIKAYFVTLNINNTQHKKQLAIILSVFMLNVSNLNVIMLSANMLNAIKLSVIMLNVMVPLWLGVAKVFRIYYNYGRVIVTLLILMSIRFRASLADLYFKRMLITIQNMQHLKGQIFSNKYH